MLNINSDDNHLIYNLISRIPTISSLEAQKISSEYESGKERIQNQKFDFPFDQDVITNLNTILPLKSNDSLYVRITELKGLWFQLIDKAIKCLRFFDKREPYLSIENKKPQSYGIEEVKNGTGN